MSAHSMQCQPQPPGAMCITAPVISGVGQTEVFQRLVIDLPTLLTAAVTAGLIPITGGAFVADAVLLTTRVEITECEVFNNKVLINGVLHKDVLLKVAPVTPIDLTGVEVIPSDCSVIVAVPLDLVLDCPFAACITVPGAVSTDTCVVDRACVDAAKEVLVTTTASPFPTQLEEKICIHVAVRTIRPQQVTITPTEPNICPPSPVASAGDCAGTGLRSASRLNLYNRTVGTP